MVPIILVERAHAGASWKGRSANGAGGRRLVQAAASDRVAIGREELKLPALAAERVRHGGYIVGELRTELPRLDPVHVDRGVDVVVSPVIAEGARPHWARGQP